MKIMANLVLYNVTGELIGDPDLKFSRESCWGCLTGSCTGYTQSLSSALLILQPQMWRQPSWYPFLWNSCHSWDYLQSVGHCSHLWWCISKQNILLPAKAAGWRSDMHMCPHTINCAILVPIFLLRCLTFGKDNQKLFFTLRSGTCTTP